MSRKASSFGPAFAFEAMIPGTSQTVSFTNVSAASSAFGGDTTLIRVVADQDCYLAFGANPTASSSNMFLISTGSPEYFGVTPGQKVAVIRSTTSGTLYITEGGV